MGTVAVAIEHPRYQKIIVVEYQAADGAFSFKPPGQAVQAAPYMHETVLAPGDGWKGQRFYQVAFLQLGAANGADLGIAGGGCSFELAPPGAVLPVEMGV